MTSEESEVEIQHQSVTDIFLVFLLQVAIGLLSAALILAVL